MSLPLGPLHRRPGEERPQWKQAYGRVCCLGYSARRKNHVPTDEEVLGMPLGLPKNRRHEGFVTRRFQVQPRYSGATRKNSTGDLHSRVDYSGVQGKTDNPPDVIQLSTQLTLAK